MTKCISLKRGFSLLGVLCLCAITHGCSDDSKGVSLLCPSRNVRTIHITYVSDTHWAQLAGGDREFDGNGPKVKFVAYHYLQGENSDSLICCVSFTALEHGGGNTNGWVEAEACVYVTPSGWRIITVGAEPCTVVYYCTLKGWYKLACGEWTFHWVGDTYGNDICDPWGNCARFYFEIITTVEIEEL